MPENEPIEFKGLGVSFNLLLSHVFPGLITLVNVFIFIGIVYKPSILDNLFKTDFTAQQLILLLFIIFLFSILSGVIVDLITFIVFGKISKRYLDKYLSHIDKNINIFSLIKTSDDLDIYKYFFEKNVLFIDAYSNIGTSLLLSSVSLFLYLLLWLHLHFFIILLLMLFYFLLITLLYAKALTLISSFYQKHMDLKEERLKRNDDY